MGLLANKRGEIMSKIFDVCGYELKEIYANPSTGTRTISASKELLDKIRDFTVDVLKQEFSVYSIKDFKDKGSKFTFKSGTGYDIVNSDLLNAGNTGERRKVFEGYCEYCKEPTKEKLELLNKQIKAHNNSKWSNGKATEKIKIEEFEGYKYLEKHFEEKNIGKSPIPKKTKNFNKENER